MDAAKVIEVVQAAIAYKSAYCERGIIAIGVNPVGEPVALALIAPECVIFSKPLDAEREIFLDVCLN